MDVVKFVLKHNLRKKLLFMLPSLSVLALITAIITVLDSHDVGSTVLCVNIFIFSIVARIYVKLLDPETLELRDLGWNKREKDTTEEH